MSQGPKDTESRRRKQSLYFPQGMLDELRAEARRLDRPISWVAQRAWQIALDHIRKMPDATK